MRDGHLPGETEDFFTEAKLMQYFQQVVKDEKENEKNYGGAIAGFQEGNSLPPHRGAEGEGEDAVQDF